MSVAMGSVSHPVTGEGKPHKFLNKTIKRVVSKVFEDTEEGMKGKSMPHCVALIIRPDLRLSKVGLFAAKTA